jgi:hypothetical protein
MSKPDLLFSLDPMTSDACRLSSEGMMRAKTTWLCPGCAQAIEGANVGSVEIRETPIDVALNFISGTDIGVIRDDFLELIKGLSLEKHLQTFSLECSERPVAGFHAFRPLRRAVVRGGEDSPSRMCNQCHRLVYHPLGSHYLLSAECPSEIELFGNQMCGIIVTRRVAEHVKQKKWKKLAITKVPLR